MIEMSLMFLFLFGVPTLYFISLLNRLNRSSSEPRLVSNEVGETQPEKPSFKPRSFFRKTLDFSIIVILLVIFNGVLDSGTQLDCCDTAPDITFAVEHRPSVYALIGLGLLAYLYSAFRTKIAPPVIELLINVTLWIFFCLNIAVFIQVGGYGFLGNVPILCIIFMQLHENYQLALAHLAAAALDTSTPFKAWIWKVMNHNFALQFPILTVLALPVLMAFSAFMQILGQKPDALIQAFTQTYYMGFSQLNHLCNNVECGDHFLCSVAAKGDEKWVKPQRLGYRNGALILCNRQLLIANAFEDWIQVHFPKLHGIIRRQYNKVGEKVHQHYGFFERKWVSNTVYALMKPLEWFFLFFLRCVEQNPENRIARQYLHPKDRKFLHENQENRNE
jgi:hypothetical protein